MEGKALILLLNLGVICAYLYTRFKLYSAQNRTRELYLSIFRGTVIEKKFCSATVPFCFGAVIDANVLACFKCDTCMFIHGMMEARWNDL